MLEERGDGVLVLELGLGLVVVSGGAAAPGPPAIAEPRRPSPWRTDRRRRPKEAGTRPRRRVPPRTGTSA